jgi:predicted ATPase
LSARTVGGSAHEGRAPCRRDESGRGRIALAETSGERFYSAELHRLRGELLARAPHGWKRKAEASFRAAIKVAKQQGATALERKANESLRRWSG